MRMQPGGCWVWMGLCNLAFARVARFGNGAWQFHIRRQVGALRVAVRWFNEYCPDVQVRDWGES